MRGSKARLVTYLFGTVFRGSRSVQVEPPSDVIRSFPVAVPKAYTFAVGSLWEKASAETPSPISGPFFLHIGFAADGLLTEKKLSLRHRLSVPAIMMFSLNGFTATREMKGAVTFVFPLLSSMPQSARSVTGAIPVRVRDKLKFCDVIAQCVSGVVGEMQLSPPSP